MVFEETFECDFEINEGAFCKVFFCKYCVWDVLCAVSFENGST